MFCIDLSAYLVKHLSYVEDSVVVLAHLTQVGIPGPTSSAAFGRALWVSEALAHYHADRMSGVREENFRRSEVGSVDSVSESVMFQSSSG